MAISLLQEKAETPKIDFRDEANTGYWCRELNCTKELLMYCVMKVGNSSSAVKDFMHMNKDMFDRFFNEIWKEYRLN